MNVTELARRLKMTTKELLDLLPELGFAIGRRAIKVDNRLVDKIIAAVEQHRREQRQAEQEKSVREIRLSDGQEQKVLAKEAVVPVVVTVKEFAEILKVPVVKIIAELMKNGVMVSLNERIDFETATIIGEDLGFKISRQENAQQEVGEQKRLKDAVDFKEGDVLVKRPPVVVVMGHVDHGKTTLLDAIRSANVVSTESGGITQHIGAYQVEEKGRKITFVDTPGHEAFSSMRSRGSKVADVAVVVVAADDGLKEQSLEVINLVQREKIPFLIAINKMDKEGADLDRVKKELSEINLIPEDYGGNVICVPVSAKKKEGISELLDMVLLVADLEDLQSNPETMAKGTVIESHMSKNEGPVATVMVQHGTLRLNDLVNIGSVSGKIKVMKDYLGNNISEALPSTPVKILGLKGVPVVGEILEVISDKKALKEIIKNSDKSVSAASFAMPVSKNSNEEDSAKKQLPIILKTDVLSSQEAILEHFAKYQDPDVSIAIVRKGLGMINESDIAEAVASGAIVFGFNVKISLAAERQAADQGVDLKIQTVIYRLFEYVEEKLKALLPQEFIRTELGKLKVVAIFKTEKKNMIVGGKVLEGQIKPNTKAKVIKANGQLVYGDIKEVRVGKEIVKEVPVGQECGMTFHGEPVIEVGDQMEVFSEEVKSRRLVKV